MDGGSNDPNLGNKKGDGGPSDRDPGAPDCAISVMATSVDTRTEGIAVQGALERAEAGVD